MDIIFNKKNFYKNTFCVFIEKPLPEVDHRKPDYKSASGSSYFFTAQGVYRLSDHWGRAANCKWRLHSDLRPGHRNRLGFAPWTAFHRDNDSEKLYYIEQTPNGILFEHKDNGRYQAQRLRTASDTAKRIRQIRNILENDSWTRYYPDRDPLELKEKVIAQMIATDRTLPQIKTDLT